MNKLRIILSLGLLCFVGNVLGDDQTLTPIQQAQQMLEQSAAQSKANLLKSFPPPVVNSPTSIGGPTQEKTLSPQIPPPPSETVPPPPTPSVESSSTISPPPPMPEAVAITPGANSSGGSSSNDSAPPNIYAPSTTSTDNSTGSTDNSSSGSDMYK